MKATVTNGDGKVKLAEVPVPKAGPYQCLCKILACATCSGTDKKIVNGTLPWQEKYPGILGHESFGRVVEHGKKVRYIKKGDLFLRPTAVYPGESLGGYSSLWGGFAEYGLVTDTRALLEDEPGATLNAYTKYQQKVPSDISLSAEDATMLITAKEVSTFLMSVGIHFNSSAVILGTGSVAMNICFFAKLLGLNPVIVIGRREEPLGIFRKIGADRTVNNQKEDMVKAVRDATAGKGADFILDAAGDLNLFSEAAKLLGQNGRMVSYAVSNSFRYTVDVSKGPARWSVLFTGPTEESGHDYILHLVRHKMIDLKLFYSHSMPFDRIEEGFELLKSKEAYKVVFTMGEG